MFLCVENNSVGDIGSRWMNRVDAQEIRFQSVLLLLGTGRADLDITINLLLFILDRLVGGERALGL